jgi:hypothetical protein
MEHNQGDGIDVADFLKWRLNRRNLLGIAGAGVATGLLSACTGGDTPTASAKG